MTKKTVPIPRGGFFLLRISLMARVLLRPEYSGLAMTSAPSI